MKRKYLWYAGAAAAAAALVYFLRRRSPPAPPAIAGTVTSGDQSTTIDTNVLSPGFGLPIKLN